MDKFRGLNKRMHTDEQILFAFENEQIFHLFGMVVGSIKIDKFFEFACIDSKTHRIINRT